MKQSDKILLLKGYRRSLDSIRQSLSNSMEDGLNYPTIQAITAIKMARMWTEQVLGTYQETPYITDGKRTTVEDILPATDLSQSEPADFSSNIIAGLDQQREDFKFFINFFKEEGTPEAMQVWKYLLEARMHLGQALGMIRDKHLRNESNSDSE